MGKRERHVSPHRTAVITSRDIYVDGVDIYGDSRFPNNDGFDPESCTNVTLVNSRISVADDGVCPKVCVCCTTLFLNALCYTCSRHLISEHSLGNWCTIEWIDCAQHDDHVQIWYVGDW